MRVAVTGATGLIGSHLVPALRASGHDVVRLTRHAPSEPEDVRWDPAAGSIDPALGHVDAAVNLSGANVGAKRWTDEYKRVIHDSRVDSTRTIARALAAMDPTPTVLVSASAIGYYGDTGETAVDEDAPSGDTFLAGACRDWEAAADPARDAGIRVVNPRTGLVMAPDEGAFGRMLPLFKLGLGGPLGSGRQYWSWVTLEDEVRALVWALEHPEVSGPVNVTGPVPVTNAEVTRALARALSRPAVLPAPAFALRAALGEFASEVLASQRVLPRRLRDSGFSFTAPDIDAAVSSLV